MAIYVEMLAQQKQSAPDQASKSHHRFNKKRLQEGNDTSLVFANLTRWPHVYLTLAGDSSYVYNRSLKGTQDSGDSKLRE